MRLFCSGDDSGQPIIERVIGIVYVAEHNAAFSFVSVGTTASAFSQDRSMESRRARQKLEHTHRRHPEHTALGYA
jgi:hypothetical protein